MKQRRTDEDICIMLKNRIAEMIEATTDVNTVLALTNAYAKLRVVEMKADEGDWGQELPNEIQAPATTIAEPKAKQQ